MTRNTVILKMVKIDSKTRIFIPPKNTKRTNVRTTNERTKRNSRVFADVVVSVVTVGVDPHGTVSIVDLQHAVMRPVTVRISGPPLIEISDRTSGLAPAPLALLDVVISAQPVTGLMEI